MAKNAKSQAAKPAAAKPAPKPAPKLAPAPAEKPAPKPQNTVADESIAFHLNGAFMRVRKGDVVEGDVAEAVKAAGGTLE